MANAKSKVTAAVLPLFVGLLATLFVYSASAETNNYIGADQGYWCDDANWSLGHAPTSGEDVTLASAKTVYATNSIAVNSLTLSAGTLDIANTYSAVGFTVTVAGDVTLSGSAEMYLRPGTTEGVEKTDWTSSAARSKWRPAA